MTTRPVSRLLPPKLTPLAAAALVICQSCTLPQPARADSRPLSHGAARPSRQPAAALRNGRPDPRYRPATGLGELRQVAGEVARASRYQIKWQLKPGSDPGPLVRISSGPASSIIFVHPVAARTVPPNTWAFIFGHEFAHRTEGLGKHSQTNPATELKADIAGARYAMAAGYRLEAFLGWVLSEPDQSSTSHGSLHGRVRAIAAHFQIPQNVIQAEARRYSKR